MKNEPLFEHQIKAIDAAFAAASTSKRAVVSLPPGAGKSRIIIEIIRKFEESNEKPILVLAPRRIQVNSVWRQEVNKWSNTLPNRIISVDGKRNPDTRRALWRNAKTQNYVVLSTPNIILNDIQNGLLNISIFKLIILDEAHHSIRRDIRGYGLAVNYAFLKDYDGALVGIAPRRQSAIPHKISKLAEVLGASMVTDESVSEKKIDRQVIKINNPSMMNIEDAINSRQARVVAIFHANFPKVEFGFLSADRMIARLNLNGASREASLIRKLCAEYLYLDIARKQLYEDAYGEATHNIIKVEGTHKIVEKIASLKEGKIDTMKEIVGKDLLLGNPVIVFARFRSSVDRIEGTLRTMGIKCAKLYGGLYDYPDVELEKIVRKKTQVLVTTQEMAGESLNLQYFRTIILLGNIANDFWRLQLEGRIRGGRVVELRYLNTKDDVNDDKKDSSAVDNTQKIPVITPEGPSNIEVYTKDKEEKHNGIHEDRDIEALGMKIAMQFEHESGRSPKDVSAQNLGYDIESTEEIGEVRHIEVKAKSAEGGIIITQNEWLTANRLGSTYWLYIVTAFPDGCTLYAIQNPASKLNPTAIGFVRYIINSWISIAGVTAISFPLPRPTI